VVRRQTQRRSSAKEANTVSQRIASFDGARGMMALFVVLWHCFLVVGPGIAIWVLAHPNTTAAWWWYAANPGQFLSQAIVVFFILSGFVLALPALRPGFSLWAYYPSRLLRLYLPAWAALVFAIILIELVPRGYASPGTWLGHTNATHVSVGQVLWEATLMPQSPTINNPLWAMSWEVAYSVLLPVYVLIAKKTTKGWLWVLGASVVVAAIGNQFQIPAFTYLPTFLIGTVAAANIEKVWGAAAVLNSSRWHTLWWCIILVASFLSIGAFRITESMQLQKPFTLINHVLVSTTVIGYTGFLLIAMANRAAVRFLVTKVVQRLGRISYSLYLVHVPILATVAFVLISNEWLVPLIAVPLSILAAIVFARFVEWPAHRFGKAVGRLLAARVVLRAAVGETPASIPTKYHDGGSAG
jgi:peptidoglycan/LPS O-acetylase OafA/YrhL